MRLRCGPRRMRGRERRVERVDLAHPSLYFSFVFLSFVSITFLQGVKGSWRGRPTVTSRARPG